MSKKCNELHKLFNKLERFKFPFTRKNIPNNGIYILFEKGEKAHSTDRVVRIGTHTGQNNLFNRLREHFLNENKDRSIFRKNIGKALLNKNQDHFLEYWKLDLTTRVARDQNSHLILKYSNKQKLFEIEVTKCIKDNFSFAVFSVNNKERRLDLEKKLISTISLCFDCKSSKNWLGNYSPEIKIRESSLWQVQRLYQDPLDDKDMNYLRKIIN